MKDRTPIVTPTLYLVSLLTTPQGDPLTNALLLRWTAGNASSDLISFYSVEYAGMVKTVAAVSACDRQCLKKWEAAGVGTYIFK